jgi:hypothetical protein
MVESEKQQVNETITSDIFKSWCALISKCHCRWNSPKPEQNDKARNEGPLVFYASFLFSLIGFRSS